MIQQEDNTNSRFVQFRKIERNDFSWPLSVHATTDYAYNFLCIDIGNENTQSTKAK